MIFFATLVRSTFGFGESLVAVPLLALAIPLEVAVPLSVLVSITVAGIVIVQDWKKIHFRSAGYLVLFSLLGTPLGLLLLLFGNEQIVKICLGSIIISFSLYSIIKKNPAVLEKYNKFWLFGCGFLAGILGGAYGLNGPPLAIYGAIRNWSAQYFRATLQGYFLPASIVGMTGFWITGLWTTEVTTYFLRSIPVIIPAIFLGRWINDQIKGNRFLKYIFFALIIIGILLIFQSL